MINMEDYLNKNNSRVIIIGGGLAGLATAYFLKQKKINFSVFEKNNECGGLCRTVKSNNFKFDYTGHLLHLSDKNIENTVKKLLDKNLDTLTRSSWIYSSNTYTRYPFQSHTCGLPLNVRKECLMGYLEAYFNRNKSKKVDVKKFKNWVMYYFGKGIAKYFMYPYNEKLWAVSVEKLTSTWMKGYVPKPSLDEVMQGTFSDTENNVGYNAYFYYPKKSGIQSLITGFENSIEQNIYKSSCVEKINIKKREVLVNGKIYNYSSLVTSVPLKELILNIIEDVPQQIRTCAKLLKANTVLNINLGVHRNISDKHWIYFPEKKYIFYRIGFNSNFASDIAPRNCTSIYTEVSSIKDIKQADYTKYVRQVLKDLIQADILTKKDSIGAIVPLKIYPAYVIYDKYRDECVDKILSFLKKHDIHSIGRYGKWDYSAMEDAMLDGYRIANTKF
jgi:protoporphyrinogen oxidase